MGIHEVLIHYDGHKKTTLHWVSADRVTYILPQSNLDKPKKKRKRNATKSFSIVRGDSPINMVSSIIDRDMTTDLIRRRSAPKRYVARPSKSGVGVEDGDKDYLTAANTLKPPINKKRVDNSVGQCETRKPSSTATIVSLDNDEVPLEYVSMVKKGKYCVGTPVQKVFNAEEDGRPRPFLGEVVSYCSDTKLYLIRYEDKDEEEILEEEMDTIAMDPSSRKRRARARRQKERKMKAKAMKALGSKKTISLASRKREEVTKGLADDNTAHTMDNWATFKPRQLVWARDGAELHPALLLSADRGKNGNALIEWASTQRVVTISKSRISFTLSSRKRRARATSPTSHAPKVTRRKSHVKNQYIKSEPVAIKREDNAYDEDTDKEEEEEPEEVYSWTRVKEEDTDDEGCDEKDTDKEEQAFMPDMPTSNSNISRERDSELPKASESNTGMAEDAPQTNTAAVKSKGNVKSSRGHSQKPSPRKRQLVWARDGNQSGAALHPAYLIREDRGRYGNAEIEWASTHRIATVPKANITWELQSRSRRG